MPQEVKARVKDFIPPEIVDRVATEEEAKTIDELKTFLKDSGNPVVQIWLENVVAAEKAVPAEAEEAAPLMPVATAGTIPITAGGFKIILKNAKIYAKKVIIRQMKSEEPKKR
jgi:acetyl-CoA decarbonylase/synthase complex subunit beta